MCRPAQKSSCSTAVAGHGFIHVMNIQDRQEEMGTILAQIAMIAEEMNVLALEGSSARRTHAEQLACVAEVKLRVREILGLATGIQGQMEQGGS
jgi:hypothetical protein